MNIKAMKQALEDYLDREMPAGTIIGDPKWWAPKIARVATKAIEQAEKQEPVAWTLTEELTKRETTTRGHLWFSNPQNACWTPIYTTSPAARRQPLTDEKIWLEYQRFWPFHPAEEPRLAKDIVKFARAIEAAHGIGDKK